MRRIFSVAAAALLAVGLGALTAKAAPPATPQGMITAKEYMGNGTGNTSVASLTNDVNFPNNPDLVYHPPYFESWASGDITVLPVSDAGDGYGDELFGYFYAPTNGNYTFWIASDDNSALYLSTDSTPANAHLIAQVNAWANRREYGTETGTTGTATTENVSSTFTGTKWPTLNTNTGGATITLVAGQAYYIEALHKEGGGGDDVSVSIDGVLPIPGSMLSSFDVPGGPPTVASITGSAFFNSVTVTFSEPLDPVSATTVSNYSLNNSVTISSATLHAASGEGDSNTVVLATSLQKTNTSYTLTINNVKDVSSNTIAASTKATFESYAWVPGWMTFSQWTADELAGDITTFVTDLSNGVENVSTFTTVEPKFDGPWLGNGVQWNNYNSVSYAWFTAPTNDSYVFFLASDDASDLFLSTDSTPANKKLIAQESGWSNEYSWETVGGGSTAADKRSDSFTASAWPTPNVITLTNGQVYYMEIDHHQGGGGAGAGATYMLADDPNIATGPAQGASGEILKGNNVIGTYLDTNGASVKITTQPASTTVVEGFGANISVVATGVSAYTKTVLYQWQKAAPGSGTFNDIPGANGSGVGTGILGLADSGTQYRVIVSVPGATTTSSAATVTVTADKTPPTVVSAGAISNQLAGSEIGVIFSKSLGAGAASLANYSLDNGATITAATYVQDSSGTLTVDSNGFRVPDRESGVVLSVSALNPADTYHLTVKNIQDNFSNAMATAVVPVEVTPFTWVSLGETVTNSANPTGATNETFTVGTNSFNLVNGGNAFWGTEDDITMVYETVDGDFDRMVQVEWNEPSSHWARAGISARASVSPADARGTTTPEYQMIISDPETNVVYGSVADSPANDQYETNRRLSTGAATTGVAGRGAPHYPNSYVRLKRTGQVISYFYSSTTNDDKWWYPVGESDFTSSTPQLPDQLFVGPTFGCENGNISGQDGGNLEFTGTFAARFRDYETFPEKARGAATSAIGLKFACDASINGGPGLLLGSNDVAGVDPVAQGHWNDLFGDTTNYNGTVVEENEKTGVAIVHTNLFVGTIGSPNLWTSQGPGADAAQDGGSMLGEDAVLMTGFLDSGGATSTDVGITNIPPSMTSQGYDVIVYTLGAVPQRGGGFGILDTNGVLIQGYYTVQAPLNPTGFIQAMPSPPTTTPTNWAIGNFVVFTNLTASAITVEGTTMAPYGVDFGGGTFRAPINAIQLVSPSGLIGGHVGNQPTIGVSGVVITYTGVLRSSPNVNGPYTPVSGATSPYTIPSAGGTRFFVAGAK